MAKPKTKKARARRRAPMQSVRVHVAPTINVRQPAAAPAAAPAHHAVAAAVQNHQHPQHSPLAAVGSGRASPHPNTNYQHGHPFQQPHHDPHYIPGTRPDLPREDFAAMAHGAHSSVRNRAAAVGALQGALVGGGALMRHAGGHLRDVHPGVAAALVGGGILAGGAVGALRGHLLGGGIRKAMVGSLARSVHQREQSNISMATHLALVAAAKHRMRIHGKFV